jgi:hypothetical protein
MASMDTAAPAHAFASNPGEDAGRTPQNAGSARTPGARIGCVAPRRVREVRA